MAKRKQNTQSVSRSGFDAFLMYRDGLRYEFCFDAHSERTPEAYSYGYDPYFIKGHKHDTEGCSSYYHDRMYQNRYDLYHEIRRALEVPHGDYFWRHISLEQASEFITRFEGKAYKVTAIGEGCNVSNGYPYWIIWFKEVELARIQSESQDV